MPHSCVARCLIGLVAVIDFGLGVISARAAEPENDKVVDGLAVYLRLLPAEMIRGHGTTHPEATTHVGASPSAHIHHPTTAELENYKIVDGVAIYVGILSAEIIRGYGKRPPEATMHGGASPSTHVFHLTVAAFDIMTGQRITDAEVKAQVSSVGLAGAERTLEIMSIADTVTYGNYFALPGQGPYQIRVEIHRPGVTKPVRAEFTYDHRIR